MEPLGRLIHRGVHSDRQVFDAAFVVATVNRSLQSLLRLPETDAQAASVQHGVASIKVSHGAIGGLIQQRADELCQDINKELQRSGVRVEPITKFITRWIQ